MTGTEAIAAAGLLLYGSFLVWAGLGSLRLLTSLVRPARPPAFVCLHLTAVWTVTSVATLAGLALLLMGFDLLAEA